MPQFAYRAKTASLTVVEGTIEADNEAAAISRLGSQGIFPISISEAHGPASRASRWLSRRISQRTVTYTTRQLADLLGGGLPLLTALTLLSRQTEQSALRRVIESLANAVRDGRSLSEALIQHPAVFPPLYVSMVRAGEVGGGLEQALIRLADLGENDAELRSRVTTASVYPLIVLTFACGAAAFLIAYVVPKLSLVYLESGQVLPWPTRFLLAVSDVFTRWWWVLGGAVLIAGVAFREWRASASGRTAVDQAIIGLPGIGALLRKIETARLSRSLGVMVSQGVPVLQALDVVGRSIANAVLRRAMETIQTAVRDGSSIAAAIAASGQFHAFVSNMVAVGEESGTVDAALLKVGVAYEREVDRTIRTLTTFLEPLLLLMVGGLVMFIVLAMLLPVFQLELVVQ